MLFQSRYWPFCLRPLLVWIAFACNPGMAQAQQLSLHCTGTLTVTELTTGASVSEPYEERFEFEKGRRDGLIPYQWSEAAIQFKSQARFQHGGIVVEAYQVTISRPDYTISKVERLMVTAPGFKTAHPIERRFLGQCSS
ncbi:MAG: hypothetical protein RL676_987 [Pseudomonadota bacterium]